MKGYKQLAEVQRHQIEALKKAKKNQKDIAGILGVSASTISRELSRNTGQRGYRPRQAHIKARTRRTKAVKSIKMAGAVVALTEEKLGLGWSPGQVSGWLGPGRGIAISHGRIYRHVWTDKRQGGALCTHLRHSGKKRKKRYGSKDKRGQTGNRAGIDERPAVVGQKTRIGDWGIDTVIGKDHQGALVTIVDRVSKFTLIKKVGGKHAEVVRQATITLLKPCRDKALTITADNGKEFADHENIAAELAVAVYFAHPYRSWERGLNGNTNGLIRQCFTKGSSFEAITERQVKEVMDRPDHRPRKTLNYKTPHAVFFGNSQRGAA